MSGAGRRWWVPPGSSSLCSDPSVGALGSWMAYLVATYSVGAHAATRRAVVGLAVSTVPAAALAVVRLRAGADASEISSPSWY